MGQAENAAGLFPDLLPFVIYVGGILLAGALVAGLLLFWLERGLRHKPTYKDVAEEDLISNTVHELRTPLTSIVAALQVVQDGHLLTEQEKEEFLAQALAACRHMTFLVNDLLESAAMQVGRVHMEIQSVDLHDVLRMAERSMHMLASSHGVTLRLDLHPDGIKAQADQSRVLQVLFNLVGNAVNFSPTRGTITLRTLVDEGEALVEIEDEGEGVAPADRSRLFARFSRIKSRNTHEIEGSGLGLYLSKLLVDRMGGSIGYRDATPGPGAVFWFRLPLALALASDPLGPGSASS